MTPDGVEEELLGRFAGHRVFTELDRLPSRAFREILLQRRFLSLMFPVIYDIGIDGLTDPTAIRLVREILREEYPDPTGDTPSHREDLVHDLVVLGATKAEILGCRPTAATMAVIEGTFGLINQAAAASRDLELMTILRFWGEVLVSVEYGEFWRRMETEFAQRGMPSRFYHPHHHHDGSDPLAGATASSSTHSGRFGACLVRLLTDPDAERRFADAERRVLALRLEFYDQF